MGDLDASASYWVDIAEYDLKTAEAMLATERYLYVGFMCRQTIERFFKAYYVRMIRDTPPDSDIDIAVIVDKLDGDYLDQQARLFKLRRSVDLRIEPVLIEYGQDPSGFLKEIMDTGHVIYPPPAQQRNL